MELVAIGKTIRAARLARALTQERLATMAGISRGTINGLETGMVKELGFHKLDAILSILGYELAAEAIPRPPGAASPRSSACRSNQPWSRSAHEILRRMAGRYIWWQTPEASIKDPHRVIAQIMDIGTLEDIQQVTAVLGKRRMVDVLNHARPGWFHPKSWAFWHTALKRTPPGRIPPIPARKRDAFHDST